jgi:hypothetical protein
MIVTTWILFAFFGIFTIHGMLRFYFGKNNLKWFHAIMWFISAIITALAAGVIWGGLFQ